MKSPSVAIRAWAKRLLALEVAKKSESDLETCEAVRMLEKLRVSLTRVVGPDGFTALMRRALALARADAPSLQNANITAEGRLKGIEEQPVDAQNSVEAGIAITAHLLVLLVTFIGEPLTLHLIRDVWPDAPDRTTTRSGISNEQWTGSRA
jgi:hypothetical protein